MQTYTIDLNGKFVLNVTEIHTHYVNFDLFECESSVGPSGMIDERYLSGSIKWDGCSHLYFGDPTNSGYLHFCGKEHFERHQKLLTWVWETLTPLISAYDKKVAE